MISNLLLAFATIPFASNPPVRVANDGPASHLSKTITAYADFQGALLGRKGPLSAKIQIQELMYGIGDDDVLTIAYGTFLRPDGQVDHFDLRSQMKTVFQSPSKMHGFFMPFSDRMVWIEEVTFARNAEDQIIVASYSGIWNGTRVREDRTLTASFIGCGWHNYPSCYPSPFNPCSNDCPDDGSNGCPCSGTGKCKPIISTDCYGECEGPNRCNHPFNDPDPCSIACECCTE